MDKETLVKKIEEFGIKITGYGLGGETYLDVSDIVDMLFDENSSKESYQAYMCDLSLEDYREFSKISQEELMLGWKCCALTAKGTQCKHYEKHEISIFYSSPKEILEESRKKHYCPQHSLHKDPLYNKASIAVKK